MKKDSIIQFVGFVTELPLEDFAPKWEGYVKNLMHKKADSTLFRQVTDTKNKFRYLSQHEWAERDFNFSFMKEKKSDHFPEHDVRVIQTGGYLTMPVKTKNVELKGNTRLVAFVGHDEPDIEYYRTLSLYTHLDIHQAYYESCAFGYIMEFFVNDIHADELLQLLKQRPGLETGIYNQCLVPKKDSRPIKIPVNL